MTDVNGNLTEQSDRITIIDPNDVTAPQIALTIPAGSISTFTEIRGSVTDANLDYYTFEVAPLGSNEFKEMFRGTSNVSNGVLGKFDPTLLENGTYSVRFTAYDTNGAGNSIEQEVEVAGELKLGNFRLSFTDLSIPVNGMAINLTRTYDSLTAARQDDFGYGWRMEFRDTDLRTSLKRDVMYETYGYRTVGFQEGDRVYITLPGGKREGFTFRAKPLGLDGSGDSASSAWIGGFFSAVGQGLWKPSFEPDKGVTSKLDVPDNAFNFSDLATTPVPNNVSKGDVNNLLTQNRDGKLIALNGRPYRPGDDGFSRQYVLTTADGTEQKC